MPSPLISVVLPAYDQQKQLADCLDSLLAQSFRDVEVILVADRSPDTAGGLADAYAARHRGCRSCTSTRRSESG